MTLAYTPEAVTSPVREAFEDKIRQLLIEGRLSYPLRGMEHSYRLEISRHGIIILYGEGFGAWSEIKHNLG
jgi:hypothetical protein